MILIDAFLCPKDGLKMVFKLRNIEKKRNICRQQIQIMSTDQQHSEKLKPLQTYADGVLPKNIQIDKLTETLKKIK